MTGKQASLDNSKDGQFTPKMASRLLDRDFNSYTQQEKKQVANHLNMLKNSNNISDCASGERLMAKLLLIRLELFTDIAQQRRKQADFHSEKSARALSSLQDIAGEMKDFYRSPPNKQRLLSNPVTKVLATEEGLSLLVHTYEQISKEYYRDRNAIHQEAVKFLQQLLPTSEAGPFKCPSIVNFANRVVSNYLDYIESIASNSGFAHIEAKKTFQELIEKYGWVSTDGFAQYRQRFEYYKNSEEKALDVLDEIEALSPNAASWKLLELKKSCYTMKCKAQILAAEGCLFFKLGALNSSQCHLEDACAMGRSIGSMNSRWYKDAQRRLEEVRSTKMLSQSLGELSISIQSSRIEQGENKTSSEGDIISACSSAEDDIIPPPSRTLRRPLSKHDDSMSSGLIDIGSSDQEESLSSDGSVLQLRKTSTGAGDNNLSGIKTSRAVCESENGAKKQRDSDFLKVNENMEARSLNGPRQDNGTINGSVYKQNSSGYGAKQQLDRSDRPRNDNRGKNTSALPLTEHKLDRSTRTSGARSAFGRNDSSPEAGIGSVIPAERPRRHGYSGNFKSRPEWLEENEKVQKAFQLAKKEGVTGLENVQAIIKDIRASFERLPFEQFAIHVLTRYPPYHLDYIPLPDIWHPPGALDKLIKFYKISRINHKEKYSDERRYSKEYLSVCREVASVFREIKGSRQAGQT